MVSLFTAVVITRSLLTTKGENGKYLFDTSAYATSVGQGGTIEAELTQTGQFLRLSIQDSGSGIPDCVRGSVFDRYLRQPALEDSRFGIGLGMVLIRSAATAHGGTVLIDQPEGQGTRITMTLAVRQDSDPMVRASVISVDYAGGWDHRLLELADALPPALFSLENND